MNRYFNARSVAAIIALFIITAPAFAEYAPDTIEFPASAPLVFDAEPILGLSDGGAIEFWTVADWSDNPGYHPVVLANGGDELPLYQISISGQRDALIVQAGEDFGLFPFDFSDGRMHHVALLDYDDRMVAFVDGKIVGAAAMSIQSGPPRQFFVGSAAGGRAPFIGAVSALRIWDMPLEPEEIAGYALRDVRDTNHPHPNLENLVGMSDFRNRTFAIVESYVLDEADMMTPAELVEALGAEEARAMDLEFAKLIGDDNE